MNVETIIATSAVFISFLAITLAVWTAHSQRKHNRLSVRPVATLPVGDYEDTLSVWLENRGLGPMKVVKLVAKSTDGREASKIIELMPDLLHEQMWETFFGIIDGAVIRPGASEKLLGFLGDMHSAEFIENRDAIRQALSQLTITVEYEDLYDKPMPNFIKKLTWFGRNLADG